MFTKRYRHYAAWASLLALTNACSDDSPGANPNFPADAGDDAATALETSSEGARSSASEGVPSGADTTSHVGQESSAAQPADGGFDAGDLDGGETNTGLDASSVAPDGNEGGTFGSEPPDAGSSRGDDSNAAADGGTADGGYIDAEYAKAFFWDAFTQQRFADGARATALLEAALAVNPGDASLALLVAHSYLWRLSEFGRNPEPDPTELPALAGASEAGFGRALGQAPTDARILGWLGSVMIGNGGAMGDAEKVAAGHTLVEQGVAAYPEFNGFVLSLVNASYPVGSAEFELAVEAMWDNLDVCAGFTTNRETPDLSAALAPVLAGQADPACANTVRAAHNLEGFFLYFGDLLLKANQETAARAMYDATRASPTFEFWPYRETLVQREQAVAARLAAYTNSDPSDDPALIAQEPFSCSYCHAASAGEQLPYTLDDR